MPVSRSGRVAGESYLTALVVELRRLEFRLRLGGGQAKIDKQHHAGKLTARKLLEHLLDPGFRFFEVGLLIAWNKYDSQAPSRAWSRARSRSRGAPR
jgi:acetyl-CoA carboxylase carboxyltransferase component